MKHNFLITLKMDDGIIASRSIDIPEYNENVIYSLRLNRLMKDMASLVEEAFRESDVERIFSEKELAEKAW